MKKDESLKDPSELVDPIDELNDEIAYYSIQPGKLGGNKEDYYLIVVNKICGAEKIELELTPNSKFSGSHKKIKFNYNDLQIENGVSDNELCFKVLGGEVLKGAEGKDIFYKVKIIITNYNPNTKSIHKEEKNYRIKFTSC